MTKSKEKGRIVFNQGADPEFDSLVEEVKKCEKKISEYLEEQRKVTGVKDINYKSLGKQKYLIEFTLSAYKIVENKLPEEYTFVSQTKNHVRYTTKHAQELQQKLERSLEKKSVYERNLFFKMVKVFDTKNSVWCDMVSCLATLDCLQSLTKVSKMEMCGGTMCRPQFVEGKVEKTSVLQAIELRHPCSSAFTKILQYIPNDVFIGCNPTNSFNTSAFEANSTNLILLTGPNMGFEFPFIFFL